MLAGIRGTSHRSPSSDDLDRVLDRIAVGELLRLLTERQRSIVIAYFALVRQHVQGPDLSGRAYRIRQDWYFLDSDLHDLASYVGPGPAMFSPAGICSFDPVQVPDDQWAIVCADSSGIGILGTVVHFLDGRSFHETAAVAIGQGWGAAIGGAVLPGGTLAILTTRPAVIRYDTHTHRLIDERPVTEASLFPLFRPSMALWKELGAPGVQFTPDGRFAYVAVDRGE